MQEHVNIKSLKNDITLTYPTHTIILTLPAPKRCTHLDLSGSVLQGSKLHNCCKQDHMWLSCLSQSTTFARYLGRFQRPSPNRKSLTLRIGFTFAPQSPNRAHFVQILAQSRQAVIVSERHHPLYVVSSLLDYPRHVLWFCSVAIPESLRYAKVRSELFQVIWLPSDSSK